MLLALVKGGGDLATGVALSLHRAGFGVVMTEIAQPTAIRLTVSFAQAVYEGGHTVEGVRAVRTDAEGWRAVVEAGAVAVLVDPRAAILSRVSTHLVVDAIMAKRNTGTGRAERSVVIGLGPGFTAGADAGADVDAVIETARGHELGRVIRAGVAREDSGVPGEIGGRGAERVLRAPADGNVIHVKEIGAIVRKGEPVARVGDLTVTAPFDGCLRGLIHHGLAVRRGMKIGDVDPRGEAQYASTVSDKARALGRAVLEAALLLGRERGLFQLEPRASGGALRRPSQRPPDRETSP
ncbi:MAG: selenium-dependent molybdenum cofactor biosynthesis protein YqeB [Spirochaetia bacterium]